MSSSGVDRLVLAECSPAAGGGQDDHLLHLHRHQQMHYHVPQHDRREKLRFASEGFPRPPGPVSLIQHHQPAAAAGSASSSFSNNANCYASLAAAQTADVATQFMNHNPVAFPTDRGNPQQHCFSLSLSSATSSSMTPPQPPRQHLQLSVRPAHPLGPFTGYAAVLSRSRFLEPAQKLLEEFCSVVSHVGVGGSGDRAAATVGDMLPDADLMDGCSTDLPWKTVEAEHLNSAGQQQCLRNSKLTYMLDEVYKRYKQCYQQVHDVIASFECVAGLSTAAPYASMALKVISKNFGTLKKKILDQLHHMSKVIGKGVVNELLDISGFGIVNDSSCHQLSTENKTFGQPQLWKPQRGLPESAVFVLRAWLFEHFLHPYPTDTDKQTLAKQTGLTRNQVSNWFINARVRLWKPMVEEVHSLESQQTQKSSAAEKHFNSDEQCYQPPTKVARTDKDHDISSKSIHQEAAHMSNNMTEPVNLAYNDLSHRQDNGIGTGLGTTVRNNVVSLTLGLQQNNVIRFAEQSPVNVAHHLGLDDCVDSYNLSSYTVQDRSLPKSVNRHFFHDLAG